MPSREEQEEQIETALRLRLFPLVPMVASTEREGWSDDQHDIDRLSRSLAAYCLVATSDISDHTAVSAVTDGSHDGGIDALYYDTAQNRLYMVQAKYKRGGAAPSQDETLKAINGVRALLDRRFDHFNAAIRNRMDIIEEALDTPGIHVEVFLAYLGDSLNQHASEDLDRFCEERNQAGSSISWRPFGLQEIHAYLLAEQTQPSVDVRIVLENWAQTASPHKAVFGQLKAVDLAKLIELHGKKLFEKNIRHYLGSTGVNSAISRTAQSQPNDLFYLNNGITAVAEEILPASPTRNSCAFELKNVSIVNGAQTAGSILVASPEEGLSPDAKLLFTIIEIGTGGEELGRRITKARNYQTAVRSVDFAALDPNQEKLRKELALLGITYHYRPSAEARTRREDSFTLEEAALALACLGRVPRTSEEVQRNPQRENSIDFIVTAKKEVGRLWDQSGELYGRLFSPELTAVRIARTVKIARMIDSILAGSEQAETVYARRMFFRHGRYFTMAFVASAIPDILRVPSATLSTEDKAAISRAVNDLAELIYAETVHLQDTKGYLAIFRNMTDSQPLADRVSNRLRGQEQPANPASADE